MEISESLLGGKRNISCRNDSNDQEEDEEDSDRHKHVCRNRTRKAPPNRRRHPGLSCYRRLSLVLRVPVCVSRSHLLTRIVISARRRCDPARTRMSPPPNDSDRWSGTALRRDPRQGSQRSLTPSTSDSARLRRWAHQRGIAALCIQPLSARTGDTRHVASRDPGPLLI